MFYIAAPAFAAIFYLQGLPLIRKRKWRELFVFTLLLALAMYYSAGQTFGFFTPDPRRMVEIISSPFVRIIF